MSRNKGANKQTVNDDPEYVTMDALKDLLDQQKTFYEDLLKRQETAFRSFTQMIMDSANKRVDSVLADLQQLKVSLTYSQNDIDELKQHQKAQLSECKELSKQVHDLTSGYDVNAYCEQIDYLENQSRRNNLVISGLGPDKADETWAETESKVQELFTTKLKLDASVEIERARRNGRYRVDSERPRSVVVKLLRFKDKQQILARARSNLKTTSVYINEDYSERVRKRRAELLPAMKEARARGDYAIISYDRLIVRPRRSD